MLKERSAEGKPSDILRAFRSLSLDNIAEYAFSLSMHNLQAPDFKSQAVEEMGQSFAGYHLMKHFPFIHGVAIGMALVFFPIYMRFKQKGHLGLLQVRIRPLIYCFLGYPAKHDMLTLYWRR